MTDPVLATLVSSGKAGMQALRLICVLMARKHPKNEKVLTACRHLERALGEVDKSMVALQRSTERRVVVARQMPPGP